MSPAVCAECEPVFAFTLYNELPIHQHYDHYANAKGHKGVKNFIKSHATL